MEEITLVKDFAVIMLVAGATTLLFRRLRQPPILGYLLAGILVGPHALPSPPVSDLHTVSLLADLGLILLLFGLGLEFSWSKIREIGLAVLLIGIVEITTMVCLGYGLGRLLGWSRMDSIFLGAALHISSSAIIVKILRDLGKLDMLSSRVIVGILVVEDFAAVVILTFLSGLATTGTASLGDIGSLVLRLVVFIAASLTLGAVVIPRLIRYVHRFDSRDTLLVISLGLCFAMALLGNYLGLSVAAGAFLMGALIGDTEHSKDVTELVSPIRDMFAALFFVTIGMLIDISQVAEFVGPALAVAVVFILGKMFINTLAAVVTGYDARTAFRVGTGQSIMGEFSLAIAKVGTDRGVLLAPVYPVVAVVTATTALTGPYLIRLADAISDLASQKSPRMLKEYASRLQDGLEAIRGVFALDSDLARRVKRRTTVMMVNLLVVVVIIAVATLALDFVKNLAFLSDFRDGLIGLVFGFVVLLLCTPSFVVIWLNLQAVVDDVSVLLVRRRRSTRLWKPEALRVILRDTLLIALSVFVAIWFVPFIAGLFLLGSYALAIPLLIASFMLYLVVRSVREIHRHVEQTFSHQLLGSDAADSRVAQGVNRGWLGFLRTRLWPAARGPRTRDPGSQGGDEEGNGETEKTD